MVFLKKKKKKKKKEKKILKRGSSLRIWYFCLPFLFYEHSIHIKKKKKWQNYLCLIQHMCCVCILSVFFFLVLCLQLGWYLCSSLTKYFQFNFNICVLGILQHFIQWWDLESPGGVVSPFIAYTSRFILSESGCNGYCSFNGSNRFIWKLFLLEYISKVGNHSRDWPEGSLFNSYNTSV